jgi:hypothetical protein
MGSTSTIQRRPSFDIPYAVHDGDPALKRHGAARSQVLSHRLTGRKIDGLKRTVDRLHEAKAALLVIGQLHSGKAARLP